MISNQTGGCLRLLATYAFLCVILAIPSYSFAQSAPVEPAGDVVIGPDSFSPIVKDLDQSLEFYRNLLRVTAPTPSTPVTFGADPALLNFLGTPTAQVRFTSVRIPGTTTNVCQP